MINFAALKVDSKDCAISCQVKKYSKVIFRIGTKEEQGEKNSN